MVSWVFFVLFFSFITKRVISFLEPNGFMVEWDKGCVVLVWLCVWVSVWFCVFECGFVRGFVLVFVRAWGRLWLGESV